MITPATQASARGPRSSIDSGLKIVPCVKTMLANGCRGTGGMRRRVSCVGFMLVIWTLGALVDGAAAQDVTGPLVRLVTVHSDPQRGDNYVVGNKFSVAVWFTEEIEITGSPTLDLTIGTETRRMRSRCPCVAGPGIGFEYVVQATDYDADGISVAPDALKLNGGKIVQQAIITPVPRGRSAALRARPAGGPRDLLALGPARRRRPRTPDQTCWHDVSRSRRRPGTLPSLETMGRRGSGAAITCAVSAQPAPLLGHPPQLRLPRKSRKPNGGTTARSRLTWPAGWRLRMDHGSPYLSDHSLTHAGHATYGRRCESY